MTTLDSFAPSLTFHSYGDSLRLKINGSLWLEVKKSKYHYIIVRALEDKKFIMNEKSFFLFLLIESLNASSRFGQNLNFTYLLEYMNKLEEISEEPDPEEEDNIVICYAVPNNFNINYSSVTLSQGFVGSTFNGIRVSLHGKNDTNNSSLIPVEFDFNFVWNSLSFEEQQEDGNIEFAIYGLTSSLFGNGIGKVYFPVKALDPKIISAFYPCGESFVIE